MSSVVIIKTRAGMTWTNSMKTVNVSCRCFLIHSAHLHFPLVRQRRTANFSVILVSLQLPLLQGTDPVSCISPSDIRLLFDMRTAHEAYARPVTLAGHWPSAETPLPVDRKRWCTCNKCCTITLVWPCILGTVPFKPPEPVGLVDGPVELLSSVI